MQRLHRLTLLFFATLVPLVPAATTAADGTASIRALLAAHARYSDFSPPGITAEQLDLLRAGEPVIEVQPARLAANGDVESVGVFALQILDAPRLLLWLSVMGGNDERDYRLKRATLSRGENGAYVRYQNVDLPWPLRDRHWVIDCAKNLELAHGTAGNAWEHYWDLHTDGRALLRDAVSRQAIEGIEAKDLERDIYLPSNRGAWSLLSLDDQRTLVIAYLDADLGGAVPASLVQVFTRRQLRAGLERLLEMSARVHERYDGSDPIHDGFGQPLSVQDAEQAARRWHARERLASLD